MSGFEPALPTAERQAIAAEWKRLQDQPPPPARRELGCMTVVIAAVLFLAGPYLLRWLGIDLPPGVKIVVSVLLGLAILVGAFFSLILVSGRYAHDHRRAETALDWLAQNGTGESAEERRAHAVALLYYAYCVDGPTTTNTIDFEEARKRLGDALPYVLTVERALRADQKIYPVFTDSKVHLPG